MKRMFQRMVVGCLGAALFGLPLPVPAHAGGPTLNGGGSSFAKLELDQWRAETARSPYDLSLNYVAQGSSFGRQQYSAGALDFAASDIPFTESELGALQSTNRKDFVYVPVSAGGLGFMYNLIDGNGQQVTNLNLTRRAVCRMFTEPNMMWDDTEIAATNAGLALPNQLVRPVVRSDGSGTSYVLSEYCRTIAPDLWAAFVQRQSGDSSLDPAFKAGGATSNWPQGWGVTASALAADGVAAAVADSTGLYGITYNEAGFAKIRGFPNASVQNQAGQFTQPTEEAVSIALGYATGRQDGTFQLDYDGPDPAAYFPSTYSYVIAQTTGFSPDKGLVLAKFLCYAVTKGQRIDLTSKLGYARLSAPLVELARVAIAQIPGAPPWDQCRVDSAPPPEAPIPDGGTTPGGVTPGGVTPGGVTPGGATPGGATTGGATTGGATTGGATTGGATTGGATSGGAPAGSTGGGVEPLEGTGGGAAGDGSAGGGADTGLPSGSTSGAGTTGGASGGSSTGAGGTAGVATSTTVSTSAAGGTQTQQTTVSIDPVTGETVVVVDPVSAAACTDPATSLPADASVCTPSDGVLVLVPESGQPTATSPVALSTPAPVNPVVKLGDPPSPDAAKILWWLLQGAGVCAVGVGLAGVRRRAM